MISVVFVCRLVGRTLSFAEMGALPPTPSRKTEEGDEEREDRKARGRQSSSITESVSACTYCEDGSTLWLCTDKGSLYIIRLQGEVDCGTAIYQGKVAGKSKERVQGKGVGSDDTPLPPSPLVSDERLLWQVTSTLSCHKMLLAVCRSACVVLSAKQKKGANSVVGRRESVWLGSETGYLYQYHSKTFARIKSWLVSSRGQPIPFMLSVPRLPRFRQTPPAGQGPTASSSERTTSSKIKALRAKGKESSSSHLRVIQEGARVYAQGSGVKIPASKISDASIRMTASGIHSRTISTETEDEEESSKKIVFQEGLTGRVWLVKANGDIAIYDTASKRLINNLEKKVIIESTEKVQVEDGEMKGKKKREMAAKEKEKREASKQTLHYAATLMRRVEGGWGPLLLATLHSHHIVLSVTFRKGQITAWNAFNGLLLCFIPLPLLNPASSIPREIDEMPQGFMKGCELHCYLPAGRKILRYTLSATDLFEDDEGRSGPAADKEEGLHTDPTNRDMSIMEIVGEEEGDMKEDLLLMKPFRWELGLVRMTHVPARYNDPSAHASLLRQGPASLSTSAAPPLRVDAHSGSYYPLAEVVEARGSLLVPTKKILPKSTPLPIALTPEQNMHSQPIFSCEELSLPVASQSAVGLTAALAQAERTHARRKSESHASAVANEECSQEAFTVDSRVKTLSINVARPGSDLKPFKKYSWGSPVACCVVRVQHGSTRRRSAGREDTSELRKPAPTLPGDTWLGSSSLMCVVTGDKRVLVYNVSALMARLQDGCREERQGVPSSLRVQDWNLATLLERCAELKKDFFMEKEFHFMNARPSIILNFEIPISKAGKEGGSRLGKGKGSDKDGAEDKKEKGERQRYTRKTSIGLVLSEDGQAWGIYKPSPHRPCEIAMVPSITEVMEGLLHAYAAPSEQPTPKLTKYVSSISVRAKKLKKVPTAKGCTEKEKQESAQLRENEAGCLEMRKGKTMGKVKAAFIHCINRPSNVTGRVDQGARAERNREVMLWAGAFFSISARKASLHRDESHQAVQ